MHPAGNSTASPVAERVGLGIFEVMGDLVQECVEKFFQRPSPRVAIHGINSHQPPRSIIAAEDSMRGSRVDIRAKIDRDIMNPVEPTPKKMPQRPDRRLEMADRWFG